MFFMDWNFPKPEEDSWYRWAYDKKYGKGAYERDLALKKNNESTTANEVKVSNDFFEVVSPFKHHWNSEHNVGVLERNGKYIGVCVLAAKEIADLRWAEAYWLSQREPIPTLNTAKCRSCEFNDMCPCSLVRAQGQKSLQSFSDRN